MTYYWATEVDQVNAGALGARGKSELQRARCWLTASRGDSKESATENKPPKSQFNDLVRVKRCGKSAPRGQ